MRRAGARFREWGLLAALLLWAAPSARAQSAFPPQRPPTLRDLVVAAGLRDAEVADNRPPLDRPITSSESTTRDGDFIAAYYFVDELDGQALGPLHVSRYARATARWTHAGTLSEHAGGSVLTIARAGPYIHVLLHWSPSAVGSLLLEPETLREVTTLSGGAALLVLSDGTIAYGSNVPHFAPIHQSEMMLFYPQADLDVEIFPADRTWPLAEQYRQSIVDAHRRLPSTEKTEYEARGELAIDDFDRAVDDIHESADGRRFAFTVWYGFDRFPGDAPFPALDTIVDCVRGGPMEWQCRERRIDDVARALGVVLTRQSTGPFEPASLENLFRLVLSGR